MANKSNAILQDSGMERAIMSGITTYGADCFFDIEDILSSTDFYWTFNQELFHILSHMVHSDNAKTFDIPSIQASAKMLGYDNFTSGGKNTNYLEDIVDEKSISQDNVMAMVAAIYKLSLARKAFIAANNVCTNLKGITGTEQVDEIIGMIEEPIFDFTGSTTAQGNGVVSLGKKYESTMKAVEESPQEIIGLPTGFNYWDMAIGGGLRPATVNVVGARPKQGKSFFCLNVAKNVAENGIPVLYLDTELTSDAQLHRLASIVSGVELNHIETGSFRESHQEHEAVWGCKEKVENLSIDHFSVAGLAPSAIISIARRWLSKTVGFNNSGGANPCLIVYDYIKLMDEGGFKGNTLQEYQLLGFLVTSLHNFATKFKLPILATVQLNRDGVDKERAEVVSGSDRIVWLCSNFSILKAKTQSELNEDPPCNGTKKLIVTDTRYGPGMDGGDYINVHNMLSIGKLIEGQPFSLITKESFENKTNETV